MSLSHFIQSQISALSLSFSKSTVILSLTDWDQLILMWYKFIGSFNLSLSLSVFNAELLAFSFCLSSKLAEEGSASASSYSRAGQGFRFARQLSAHSRNRVRSQLNSTHSSTQRDDDDSASRCGRYVVFARLLRSSGCSAAVRACVWPWYVYGRLWILLEKIHARHDFLRFHIPFDFRYLIITLFFFIY